MSCVRILIFHRRVAKIQNICIWSEVFCFKVNAPVVTDRSCQERVCQVDLGPIKLQNCIIPDNAICAGGMGGRGPCRVRFYY